METKKLNNVSVARTHDSGIDCLRCLLMYFVVIHHVSLYSTIGNAKIIALAFLISMPAVDGFISISGWYGVRFTWKKVLSISGQIVYYAILNSVLSIILAHLGYIEKSHIGIGNAWYGICYLSLIFTAPLINVGTDYLIKTEKKRVWLLFIPLIVDYFSRCIGLGFTIRGLGSHTFATFFYVYLFVRMYRISKLKTRMLLLLAIFVTYVMLFLFLHLSGKMTLVDIVTPWGGYNCPLVIISGLLFVELFTHYRPVPLVARICAAILPSVFSIYLIHDVSSVGKCFLVRKMVDFLVVFFAPPNDFIVFALCIGISILIFIIAILIDVVIRRFPLFLLRTAIGVRHVI